MLYLSLAQKIIKHTNMNTTYKTLFIILICSFCFLLGAFISEEKQKIDRTDIVHAEKLISIELSEAEIDSIMSLLDEQKLSYDNMRKFKLSNNVPPAYNFNPVPVGKTFDSEQKVFETSDYSSAILPADINAIAYYSIGQLAQLIRNKKISSVQLTNFFLDRLKKYSPDLHCVITYTDSLALQQARLADEEISGGIYRGLLHGIPYGLKDMYATENYRTTYGTPPYKDQYIHENATIVKMLNDAGAILIAKLSLGELAMDDVWFEGRTRNPWDTSKGSSGSSAGPASAVSAGLLPFAIGSETWGSIVSPSTVCGVTGLRPTYGRVSRTGAMALSWTMDKVGPLCRNVEDCAIVFKAIYGPDGKDQTLVNLPFNYSPEIDLKNLKIGFFKSDFDQDTVNRSFNNAAIEMLRQMGAQLISIDLPDFPVYDMSVLLLCEAASAFEELTLSGRDDEMVQQNKYSWPGLFRAANFIPATEYIRANRLRYLLIQQMEEIMKQVDVCIAPSLAGNNLLITNFTGHPSVVIPNGFIDPKKPTSIVFTGQLYDEGILLAVVKKYQDATDFHLKHPPGF